ncbi:MAG TPA: hypothetical protein VGC41_13810, partial [Kofleriaceae bacterium]
IAQIKQAIAAFKTWSGAHPHDDCAAATALGTDDPWGQPLIVTCTDQPGDQLVGISSAGPDRKPGTADDLISWQLGGDVTELARGARWKPQPVEAKKPAETPATVKTVKTKQPTTKPADTGFVDLDGDGIPDKR